MLYGFRFRACLFLAFLALLASIAENLKLYLRVPFLLFISILIISIISTVAVRSLPRFGAALGFGIMWLLFDVIIHLRYSFYHLDSWRPAHFLPALLSIVVWDVVLSICGRRAWSYYPAEALRHVANDIFRAIFVVSHFGGEYRSLGDMLSLVRLYPAIIGMIGCWSGLTLFNNILSHFEWIRSLPFRENQLQQPNS